MTVITGFVKYCANGAKRAFPFFVFLIGFGAFAYSIWGTFAGLQWREFWNGIGKTFIVSGLFTFLIKYLQFSGVFKAEITKVIFEPEYLSNRNDLPRYWEKVSQQLFKSKFPNISGKLLKDIQEKYMLTKHVMYYEDVEHLIEVDYDSVTGNAKIKRTFRLNVVTENKKETYYYEFGSEMPFKEDEKEVNFVSSPVRVNGTVVAQRLMEHRKKIVGKTVIDHCKVKLSGSEKYQIERSETKEYNLLFDNLMYFSATRMYNKMKVEIHYPKDKLKIELRKSGTLDSFNLEQQTSNSERYSYRGIVYPEQGYYINLRPL